MMVKLSAAEEVTPLHVLSGGEGCEAETGSHYFPYCCTSADHERWFPVDRLPHCAMSPETGCQNRKVGRKGTNCGCVLHTERLFFG